MRRPHQLNNRLFSPSLSFSAYTFSLPSFLPLCPPRSYPRSNAVLVRRHGVYVWGSSWEAAKTQAECYHYLFDAAVRMRGIGVDPAAKPTRTASGIGAETSYGTEGAGTGGKRRRVEDGPSSSSSSSSAGVHVHTGDACCGGAHDSASGFNGAAGIIALSTTATATAAGGSPGSGSLSGPAPASAAPGSLSDWDAVLLDIEGTTTSISFVTDVLFPFAAAHLRQHLLTHWGAAEAVGDVRALAEQSAIDVHGATIVPGAADAAVTPEHLAAFSNRACPEPAKAAALAAIEANVAWQMGSNRKSGCLKQLQGHIWRSGYEGGVLTAHVFEDTPAALKAWAAAGKRSYIYSSGSREAQRLLFAHTAGGNLRGLLSGYFDTKVGPKTQPASYADIALSLGVDAPSRVLFLTDAIAEARAAAAAGMRVAITDRPGNVALPPGHGFRVVSSLMELTQ